jgi:hypothetical protein
MNPAFQIEGLDQDLPFTKLCKIMQKEISRLRIDMNDESYTYA